jgi:hypothetical protein
MLLRDLAVVQRVEVRLGSEVKTWYLNLTESASVSLKAIGIMELYIQGGDSTHRPTLIVGSTPSLIR